MDQPNDLHFRQRYAPRPTYRGGSRLYYPEPAPQPSGPSPLLGLLMLVVAGVLALVIVFGVPSPGPGPGPNPNPDVVIGEEAEKAEIAGKVGNLLKADVMDQLADETEAGKFETVAAWQAEAEKRNADARLKSHSPLYQTLNDFFPDGKVTDHAKFAELQREFAKGFRRSGK